MYEKNSGGIESIYFKHIYVLKLIFVLSLSKHPEFTENRSRLRLLVKENINNKPINNTLFIDLTELKTLHELVETVDHDFELKGDYFFNFQGCKSMYVFLTHAQLTWRTVFFDIFQDAY